VHFGEADLVMVRHHPDAAASLEAEDVLLSARGIRRRAFDGRYVFIVIAHHRAHDEIRRGVVLTELIVAHP
jgi:hypothetical protein